MSVLERQLESPVRPRLTLVEAVVATDAPARPRWRGVFHLVAFFVAIPAAALLVHAARGGQARTAAAVYGVALCALFGVSGAYHRLPWSVAARRRMRRADHATIFVMIAATYTPLCLVVLHGTLSIALLACAWTGALAGAAMVATGLPERPGRGFVEFGLYLALGWMALTALPQIASRTSTADLLLLMAGGLMFTVGATILGRRRPDPAPLVFGYHEVWHTLVIAASICHYLMILSFVRGG